MFYLVGSAASSALDLISTLQQTLGGQNSSTTSSAATQSFDVGAGTSGTSTTGTSGQATSPLAPSTMDALLAAQGSGQTPVVNGDAFSQQLFSMLDSNGDGSISQSEFDSVFGQNGNTSQANAIFSELDANGDGSVSPDELTNALSGQTQGQDGTQQVHHHHHHGGMGGAGAAGSTGGSSDPNDPFSTNASGTSSDPFAGDQSQTVTNSDGSNTTTITYADGSQVTMTIPASSGSGMSPDSMAQSFMQRMIQHQAQLISQQQAGQSLAISA